MADYPDWTDSVQIVGTDIMVAIDLQAAYIMMPIDIQAQYVDLDINIKSQTVTVNIDIDAQSVGVYLQPDWNVLQGTDKNLFASASVATATEAMILDYTVPTGKTFYICQFGFHVTEAAVISAILYYYHDTTETYLFASGGYNGGGIAFTKPIAVVAGDKIRVYVKHSSASTETCRASVGGYEL